MIRQGHTDRELELACELAGYVCGLVSFVQQHQALLALKPELLAKMFAKLLEKSIDPALELSVLTAQHKAQEVIARAQRGPDGSVPR